MLLGPIGAHVCISGPMTNYLLPFVSKVYLKFVFQTLNRNYQEFQQRLAEPASYWAASPSRSATSGPRPLLLSPRHPTLFSTGTFTLLSAFDCQPVAYS